MQNVQKRSKASKACMPSMHTGSDLARQSMSFSTMKFTNAKFPERLRQVQPLFFSWLEETLTWNATALRNHIWLHDITCAAFQFRESHQVHACQKRNRWQAHFDHLRRNHCLRTDWYSLETSLMNCWILSSLWSQIMKAVLVSAACSACVANLLQDDCTFCLQYLTTYLTNPSHLFPSIQ